MRHFPAKSPAALLLLLTAALVGCATDKARSRHTPCAPALPQATPQQAATTQPAISAAAGQTAPQSSVQLASFEQPHPAEVIVPPDATPLDPINNGRHS